MYKRQTVYFSRQIAYRGAGKIDFEGVGAGQALGFGVCLLYTSHNMQQAARISDRTAFFLLGEIVEFGKTEQIFSMPKDKRTEDYITGRFG